jgi:hypothetical protein
MYQFISMDSHNDNCLADFFEFNQPFWPHDFAVQSRIPTSLPAAEPPPRQRLSDQEKEWLDAIVKSVKSTPSSKVIIWKRELTLSPRSKLSFSSLRESLRSLIQLILNELASNSGIVRWVSKEDQVFEVNLNLALSSLIVTRSSL